MKRYLLIALLTLAASVSAQVAAGPNRPGNVPDGYVVTPFGYFHSSCVQTVASSDTLLADGRVQHKDGTVSSAATCNYPRYAHDGTPKVASQAKAQAQAPEVNGWIESTSIVAPTNKSFSGLWDSSIVPSQPRSNDGQVLFFFPGLEDINDPNTSILQPVLTWSAGQWTVSNWNCCLSNIVVQSTPININPGDRVVSSTVENCRPGTLSCTTWNITSWDTNTGGSTTLLKTPSDGQVFNWAFGAVLEPYYVVSCEDYPIDRETYYTAVFDEYFHLVNNPKWSDSVNTTETPQCGYKVRAQPYEITLSY